MNGPSQFLRSSSRTSLPKTQETTSTENPHFWQVFSRFMTLFIPTFFIKNFYKKNSRQEVQAWREKVTLCLLIFLNCVVLWFITYGVNLFICNTNNILIFSKIKKTSFKEKFFVANGFIYGSEKDMPLDNYTHLFKKSSAHCKSAFKRQATRGTLDEEDYTRKSKVYFEYSDAIERGFIIIDNKVYDPRHNTERRLADFIDENRGRQINSKNLKKYDRECVECFKETFYSGELSYKTGGCIFADILLCISSVIIFSILAIKFSLAFIYAWYNKMKKVKVRGNTPVILQVTCYTEGEGGLRATLDSLVDLDYDEDYKLIVVIADGQIKGAENDKTTPEILLDICEVDDPEPKAYLSLSPGHKRFNRAKVHTGTYAHKGKRSKIMIINKVGNHYEENKKGNRGKRDSQVIVMSFFNKILYKDRMSEIDVEIYRKMKMMFRNIEPEDFEIILMADADTLIEKDAITRMVSEFERDNKIIGLCGETRILNKAESFITMIQVFEYYISHHCSKNFESVFGGVTCLPGCFCVYRIKIVTDEYGQIKNHQDIKDRNTKIKTYLKNSEKCEVDLSKNIWTCLPILANPLVLNPYSVYEAKTLHEQNLLHLGEDRYLTTLLLKNFYKRKLIFLSGAKCSTYVPNNFRTLLSQRRRWINSTIHNMFELVLVDKLCGTNCFSMQFVIFIELFGTLTLPAAIFFTGVLVFSSIFYEPAILPLVMLLLIFGLPAILVCVTTFEFQYIFWLLVYMVALPIWNFILPVYAFWHFDDFSWGQTRKIDEKEVKNEIRAEFDSSMIKYTEYEKLKKMLNKNEN